jgi:hypothetical protein
MGVFASESILVNFMRKTVKKSYENIRYFENEEARNLLIQFIQVILMWGGNGNKEFCLKKKIKFIKIGFFENKFNFLTEFKMISKKILWKYLLCRANQKAYDVLSFIFI